MCERMFLYVNEKIRGTDMKVKPISQIHKHADAQNYLQMSNGENDRVREVDFVRVLVDGGCDDRRVDDHRVVGGQGFAAQLHAGVLS